MKGGDYARRVEESMRNEISKILIKWSMPTRQPAISEIIELFSQQKKDLLEGIVKKNTYWGTTDYEGVGEDVIKTLATLQKGEDV